MEGDVWGFFPPYTMLPCTERFGARLGEPGAMQHLTEAACEFHLVWFKSPFWASLAVHWVQSRQSLHAGLYLPAVVAKQMAGAVHWGHMAVMLKIGENPLLD